MKDLTEELNTLREKLSDLEVNVGEKENKQETSEKKKNELFDQNVNFENELLIATKELEDVKNKDMVATKELVDLNLTLETSQ